MKPEPPAVGAQRSDLLPAVFAGMFGVLLGLSLLKFGNPPITEKWVTAPTQLNEFLFSYPWPIGWAYGLLALTALVGVSVARWKLSAPWWVVVLPMVWLVWQCIASTKSAEPTLTEATLKHFIACAVCFYLGYFSLSRVRRLWLFWAGLLGGFLIVLAAGWEQHLGGLEASRRYFFLYVYPGLTEVSPDYLKKINSNRIFATLFYPNTLAGALLLLLPATLAGLWQLRAILTPAARWFLMGVVGVAGLACLYWSGSKGGWLLMLLIGLVGLLRFPFSRQLKLALVTAILLAGLAGFFWRHAVFFQKGATSVGARFDYWGAAVQTAMDKPLLGTGPGTFASAYQKVKRPESEMARLTHNDYLQQASDSGFVGFLAYTLFIVSALVCSFPRAGESSATGHDNWQVFAVWLGALGWSLQGLVEFGLYIPALAWPVFAFLGWLLGIKNTNGSHPPKSVRNPLDNRAQSR
ncbi:MAG TPA: O-antigen ligase family protein [Candidatus Paceibacterota bacterium]|nr:O-antigen ligase family protein [Verrucomicrobiota bacterium]HSA10839.1 O-antigen ligase family protein [Candidatus Paceibacterota bacterium]